MGATGALRPAVAALRAGGAEVHALARHVDLAGVVPVAVDWHDTAAVRVALEGRELDEALVYAPTAPAASVAALVAAVSGRVVRLLPSAALRPPATLADLAAPDAVRVVLGWARGAGGSRWHTPAEISAAALGALRDGHDTVLGAVRPWSHRPV
ncbi:Rossmann-fold NAD(P)-binding domain-containing protein [Jatrophihabitans endophyticus]|uniref:hypothetical protein n=1 Tax=Jatrophihabitans endophyticus TaxID=1206085 RepID=UPI00116104D8|nr:hypothetical protein [Jatrophihabitans endophyticus]